MPPLLLRVLRQPGGADAVADVLLLMVCAAAGGADAAAATDGLMLLVLMLPLLTLTVYVWRYCALL